MVVNKIRFKVDTWLFGFKSPSIFKCLKSENVVLKNPLSLEKLEMRMLSNIIIVDNLCREKIYTSKRQPHLLINQTLKDESY